MPPRVRSTAAVIAALVVLASASVMLQIARDRIQLRFPDGARYLYVESGTTMRHLVGAYQALAADVYWIRTIQHYGGDRLSAGGTGRYELLYPLLDITTSLDPHFTVAYRFGAVFLAEAYPGGPGRPDRAVALLRKGVAADPSKWEYLHDIAFVFYWQLRDTGAAARWFQRAAQVEGAPNWLAPLAATMLIQGGDRASSRFLWRQLRDSADQEWLRNLAERRLAQLDALDQIDDLQARVLAFVRTAGPVELRWRRLVDAGVLPGMPVDPTGTPYDLDPVTGAITVSPRSPLFPMPVEPAQAGPAGS